jgi:predicted metal-dependent hydrolase
VIILTRLLDSTKAPELLVRFVMFHEMLHLRYPTQHKGARRCVHTPEFKRAEREFVEYRAARLTLALFVQLGHA